MQLFPDLGDIKLKKRTHVVFHQTYGEDIKCGDPRWWDAFISVITSHSSYCFMMRLKEKACCLIGDTP
jgi:hypothetical protein